MFDLDGTRFHLDYISVSNCEADIDKQKISVLDLKNVKSYPHHTYEFQSYNRLIEILVTGYILKSSTTGDT